MDVYPVQLPPRLDQGPGAVTTFTYDGTGTLTGVTTL